MRWATRPATNDYRRLDISARRKCDNLGPSSYFTLR